MLLVLKNADFSGNNLGNISINLPINEDVKRILSMYTKYPARQENEFTQALNSLVISMKNLGIYDKVTVLSIPIMASNISECKANAKSGELINNTAFDTQYALDDNGMMYKTSAQFLDTTDVFGYSISHSSDDFMMFGVYNKYDGVGNETQMCGGRVNSWYGFKNTFKFIETGPSGQITAGGVDVQPIGGSGALLASFRPVTTPFVLSYDNGSVYYRDKRVSRSGSYEPSNQSLIQYYPLLAGGSSKESKGSYLLYGCGYKLSESEVNLLYNMLEKFYNSVIG